MVEHTAVPASNEEEPHPLLARAAAAGLALYIEDGRLRWRASGPPPDDLLAALRADREAVTRAVVARAGSADASHPSPLAPALPEGMPHIERGGMTAERAARAYLRHPMAVVAPQPDGWLHVSLPDGRALYIRQPTNQRARCQTNG